MWDLAVREEDWTAVDSMLARYRGPVPISFRLVPARGRGDAAAIADALEEARGLESRQLQLAGRYSAAYLDDPGFADSIVRLDLTWRERPANLAQARILLAWIAVAEGRWGDALREFDTAESMEGAGPVIVHRAFAATLPFLAPSSEDLERIRLGLERWQPPPPAPGVDDPAASLGAHLREYLIGLVTSRDGDDAAFRASLARLDRLPVPTGLESVLDMMRATLAADRAWRAGRGGEALEVLQRQTANLPLEFVALPRPTHLREFGFEHARFLRALAAAAEGLDAEARSWLEHGLTGSPQELAYRAPLHFELGQLLERMGQGSQAAAHYEKGLAIWRRADPALAPRIAEIRTRLEHLTAGGRP